MDPVSHLDLQGPPRKKMRKGTKSCVECRRRKIRCTFDPKRRNICNECHARGSSCIDQEHAVLPPGGPNGEQPYSLRERVAQLEIVVTDVLERLDRYQASGYVTSSMQRSPAEETERAAKALRSLRASVAPTPTESSASSPRTQLESANAPVLQLFNNCVVSREEDASSSNDNTTASGDMTPKASAARATLISLLPPNPDIDKILNGSTKWWATWHTRFPEICDQCRKGLLTGVRHCEVPMAPAEVAKMLLCLIMSIEQLPLDFDYAALQSPLDPKGYTDRCVLEIDRLIVHDDDFAATLPGIECMMLLGKYHANVGRPRKSWLINRRAVEFAQLTGMHLSTAKPPLPGDKGFDHRLQVWIALVCSDRFLSLILGLPYAVSDATYVPQIQLRLQKPQTNFETYVARLGVFLGQLIDRNQSPGDMSLPETLKMDQDLEEITKEMPRNWWDLNTPDQYTTEENCDRVMTQFYHNFLRALLHLPFMLKSTTDRRSQYSHDTAIESSRSAMVAYITLRSLAGINPYICKVIDFLAFTVAMLLVIHLLGFSEESPNYNKMQDEKDWNLVKQTTEILRNVAKESGGTVAAQSANILGMLHTCDPSVEPLHSRSCKITVPYFGTITVAPGKKFSERNLPQLSARREAAIRPQTSNQISPNLLYTPPQSNPTSSGSSVISPNQMGPTSQIGYPDESWVQLENMVALPHAGLDPSGVPGFFDDLGLGMWSNINLDLDLDQGWNLNWTEDGNALITS